MPTLDLSAEAAAVGLELDTAELERLSPAERDAICLTWQGRMLNEHVSARGSSEEELVEAGSVGSGSAAG